eukprot:1015402-Rhodomonas_salina.1
MNKKKRRMNGGRQYKRGLGSRERDVKRGRGDRRDLARLVVLGAVREQQHCIPRLLTARELRAANHAPALASQQPRSARPDTRTPAQVHAQRCRIYLLVSNLERGPPFDMARIR